MTILNHRFDEAPSTKTHAGAMKRITDHLQRFEDDESGFADELRRINYFVLQRPDGRYVAVATLRYDEGHWSMSLMSAKICVTN